MGGRLYWKCTGFSLRTATEAPADRQSRSAGASVVVAIGNATLFHCGRPQKHQRTGKAGLLVPRWSSLLGMQRFFIADGHRGTNGPAKPVCWCLGGRLYWKCNVFSLRTATEAPADRQSRSAGASVVVSTGNATVFHCGR